MTTTSYTTILSLPVVTQITGQESVWLVQGGVDRRATVAQMMSGSIGATVLFANGSASSPSISFINSPHAGFYLIGTDNIGATVNSTKVIDISSSAIAFTPNVVPATNDGAALGTTALEWSDLFLASGGVINWNSGNVTLTHSSDKLAVSGANTSQIFQLGDRHVIQNVVGDQTAFARNAYFDGVNWKNLVTGESQGLRFIDSAGGGIAFFYSGSASAGSTLSSWNSGAAEVFNITSGGVVNVIPATTSSSSSTGALVVTGGVGVGDALNVAKGATFATTSGNVGIGTTSPTAKIQVVGSTLFGSAEAHSASGYLTVVHGQSDGAATYAHGLYFQNSGGWGLGAIFAQGSAGFAGNLYFATVPSGGGSYTAVNRMAIDQAGQVSVLTATDATTTTDGALYTAGGLSVAKNAVIGGGIQVGSPTGGDKGAGTINCAGDIYKNNTAYTSPDFVFEKFYTGNVVKFSDNERAKNYDGLMPLAQLRDYTRSNLRLPRISDQPSGMFERGDIALEKIEEAHLYIMELHERIAQLEARLH